MSKLGYIVGASFLGYLFFNRRPIRTIIQGNNLIAPADGTVEHISDNSIEIFIGLLDQHFQMSPSDGIVTSITDTKEHSIIELDTSFGNVTIERWAGDIARTVTTFVKVGDSVKKGYLIGRILLGSHASITIPSNLMIKVNEGQHVLAGETVIAE